MTSPTHPGTSGYDWGAHTDWNRPGTEGESRPLEPALRPPHEPTVKNHMLPAVLVTVLFFLPTGIAAIVYASQVKPKATAGDIAGAQRSSAKARTWIYVSIGVGVLWWMFLLGF